jgi:hypothetical protein
MLKRLSATRFWLLASTLSVTILAIGIAPYGRSDHVDNFWFARLYIDIFHHDGYWGDWHFAPVPNLFPEISLYFLLSSLGLGFGQISLVYPLAILTLSATLVFLLARILTQENSTAALAALSFSATLILVGEEVSAWSRPTIHYGTFFNLLLALVVLNYLLASSRSKFWLWLVLFLSISIIGTASDFLFIPIFLAAMVGATGLSWIFCQLTLGKGFLLVVVTLFGIGVGIGAYFFLVPNAYSNPVWASGLSLRYVSTNLEPHINALFFLTSQCLERPYLLVGLIFAAALPRIIQKSSADNSRYVFIVSGFVVAGLLANLYVFGLGAQGSALYRYTVFATNISLFLVCLSLAATIRLLPINKKILFVVCYIILGITALMCLVQFRSDTKNTKQEYTALLRVSNCVQTVISSEKKLGLADYHWANKLTVLTKGRIILSPVKGNTLGFMPWLGTRHWANHDFHFIVTQRNVAESVYGHKMLVYPLSTEKAITLAGNPDKTSVCGNLVLLHYSDPIQI